MKNTIYNKIRYSVLTAAGVLAMSSCTDFLTLTPSDKIVLEDYWKTKDDVDQMVTGTYKHLLSSDIIERAILWGELRTDEVKKVDTYVNSSMDNIVAVNLLPSIGYNSWSAFYRVINDCNLVMLHAPEVVDLDPAFSEGDYQTVKAQMLALRALCHFYLIRTFRDVPYVTKPYENTDDMEVEGQLPPAETLQKCLDDLLEAEPYCYKYGTFGANDWRSVGYLSRDAVDAIIADVYLWRASLTHSASDYQQVVNYTQKIIDSREAFYQTYKSEYSSINSSTSTNPYHLIDGRSAAYYNFVSGNSFESIFELQYSTSSGNYNSSLSNMYFKYYVNTNSRGATPSIVGTRAVGAVEASSPVSDSHNTNSIFATKNDYRYWTSLFGVSTGTSTSSDFEVRKMVDNSVSLMRYSIPDDGKGASYDNVSRAWDTYAQNWILYRFTDILLMRAEALTQLASEDDDQYIHQAFDLVKNVNQRSIATTALAEDSLKYTNYKTKSVMELLVLQERGRELCFEGKRWYDLVRHSYRHMTGVDITRTLNQIDPEGSNFPSVTASGNQLCTIISAGGEVKVDALRYKMKNECYLYWPIYQTEIERNSLLKQNPVWIETQTSERN